MQMKDTDVINIMKFNQTLDLVNINVHLYLDVNCLSIV